MSIFSSITANSIKYGRDVNTNDLFKTVAVILMTIDHIGSHFMQDELWLRVIGRFCVPIWFFFCGYCRPSRPSKELYVLAAIMIIVDVIVVAGVFPWNILVTIIVTRYVIHAMADRDKDAAMLLVFIAMCTILQLPTMYMFEYGAQIFLFALAGYYMRWNRKHWLGPVTLFLACINFSAIQYVSFGMEVEQGIVMTVGLLTVCYALYHFETMPCNRLTHIPIINPMFRILGRNTHYYYVAHYVAFLLISTALDPPDSWGVDWIAG